MIKKYLLVFIILTGTNLFASTPDILWTKTFGGDSSEGCGKCIQETFDKGYILTGRTWSFGAGKSDIWVIKTDKNGDTLWTKTYGTSNCENGYFVQQTQDSGYIIIGQGICSGDSVILLIKTDINGNALWTKTYNTGKWVYSSCAQTSDSGYIILLYNSGSNRLIKTDKNYDTLWSKVLDEEGSQYECGNQIQQTFDGGFIIIGDKCISGMDSGTWLLKTNTNGDTLWSRNLGGGVYPTDAGGCFIEETADSGYIITGYVYGALMDLSTVTLTKTKANGDVVWDKDLGTAYYDGSGYCVRTISNGYIIVGSLDNDLFLCRTDKNGDTCWTKTYGGSDIDRGCYVLETSDSGYIIVGETYSYGVKGSIWLLKVAEKEAVQENSNLNPPSITLRASQNPFSKSTVITYSVGEVSQPRYVSLAIYDLTGSCVKTLLPASPIGGNESKPAGSYSITLNAKELKTGIYFVRLTTGKYKLTQKLILMK
jgi:hypothetical protein